MSASNSQRVKVGVRIRPLSNGELDQGAGSVVSYKDNSIFMNLQTRSNNFDFDWVFGPNSTQECVYNNICKSLLEHVFEGFNATVFACKLLFIIFKVLFHFNHTIFH